VIDTDGAFARLLVHGLAEFHGLGSRSEGGSAQCRPVVVYHRQQATAAAGPPEGQEGGAAPGAAAGAGTQGAAEVTCTDVLLALRELGQSGLSQQSLAAFVRTHVHGSDHLMEEDYVLV
jgi:hypothetical protein